MYADHGPGQTIELDPPTSESLELLASHVAIANHISARNLYTYASDNPNNRLDPQGLQDRPAPQRFPLGAWLCQGRPTNQTTGKVLFDEEFERDCVECTSTCQIRVTANRCFHESVEGGDDNDPRKFYTILYVQFIFTNRKCGGEVLPDVTYRRGGCTLYPGRLVFPGGPLSDTVMAYIRTLESCNEFDFQAMCDAVKRVPPPERIP